jgi:hypothetical protein
MTQRDLIRRPTAIALAFKDALNRLGYATDNARMPLKREPTWSVKRAKKG